MRLGAVPVAMGFRKQANAHFPAVRGSTGLAAPRISHPGSKVKGLEDAIAIVRGAWTQDVVSHHGEV